MNFLSTCFAFIFFFPLSGLCKRVIVADTLSDHLLRGVEAKGRSDRFVNAYIIGKVTAKCMKSNYENKNNQQCITKEALNILKIKNYENGEIFINQDGDDYQSFLTISQMQNFIEKLQNFNEKPNEKNYKIIAETCLTLDPAQKLGDSLKNLKSKSCFYFQSKAYDHDVRPFRRLKDAWNSYILMYSTFVGICNAFGITDQKLPESVTEFDKLMNEQERSRKETFLHSTVKAMTETAFFNKIIFIEDLKSFRDLLNEMFEDLHLFAVISIPNGSIFIPPTTSPNSYLYHITNLNAHILIYPTFPSNTYKHIRETDPSLLNFNYDTVGPLFGKGPYCFLYPNETLILSTFYANIESVCNDRLSCIIFESSSVEVATTNANIFLRNSNIDCGWFSNKDLFLLAKHTPKSDLYYEKEDKRYINIYLSANTRLNNTVFNIIKPE